MLDIMVKPRLMFAGVSAAAMLGLAGPVLAQSSGALVQSAALIDEVTVTAERREEGLQETPVAVSALTDQALSVMRIDGGQNLLWAVPNLNYSRGEFGGYNLVIRGIGTKATGNSSDAGVSFHQNNTPITGNRLADADFYDVDRVEVLRGPQGTLYGRNATGGVVNVITTKPGRDFGGYATAEYGNYDSLKLKAAVNIPLGDMLSVRWAGVSLKRDGFGTNTYLGSDIDGRNLSSSRLAFRLRPNDDIDVTATWEHFNEKDDRSRVGKQLCITDPGPTSILGVPVSAANRGLLSQGCLPGSRYQDAAFGTSNSAATLGGLLAQVTGLAPAGDLNAGKTQDRNLRDIEAVRDPIYEGREDFFQVDAAFKLTDALTLNSLTGLNLNKGYNYEDYGRVVPTIAFAPTGLAARLFPGGVVNDAQVGNSNLLRQFDYGDTNSREFTQELRLSSNYRGRLNFSLGGIHINYHARANYDVFSNGLTAYAQLMDAGAGRPGVFPFYVDPNFPPTGEGHNYFDSRTDFTVRSDAAFGELYWNATDTLKLTLGARYTRDRKGSDYVPIALLQAPTRVAMPPASGLTANPAFNGGQGFPAAMHMKLKSNAATGRVNLEWSPTLSFTDRSMFYASYSRGYKGGGFNTPCDAQSPGCGLAAATFAPEHVDAFEVGSKNVLAGGRLVLNATAFLYDYNDYQITTVINKSSQIGNVDAKVGGLELESIWEPVDNLRFNLDAGWLRTRISGGSAIDTLDRTQGDQTLALIKAQDASNCVVNRAALAKLVAINEGLPGAPNIPGVTGSPTALLGACSGQFAALGLYTYAANVSTAPIFVNGAPGPNTTVQVGQGVPASIKGKDLPNAPDWTLSFGAQYGWDLPGNWRALLRGDYYRQADSYARIFNTASDRLKGYQNINATFTLARADLGLEAQLFVKNLTNETPITDLYLGDDSSGLFTNSFTLEPRQFGVSVTKRF